MGSNSIAGTLPSEMSLMRAVQYVIVLRILGNHQAPCMKHMMHPLHATRFLAHAAPLSIKLRYLDLSNNLLTGAPDVISSLTSLTYVCWMEHGQSHPTWTVHRAQLML